MSAQPTRVMIAALHGRSGKTVITLGILRSLIQRGLAVQPYKKGPDFIDPSWHIVACKRQSRNLDSFFMLPEQIRGIIARCSEESVISVIEGAMGIFDGLDTDGSTSSAEIAKISSTPVILVVDATRMTRTAAALVMGCQHFDPKVSIAGVILNRVRGARHEALMRESIESYCGIPVVGALPHDERLIIPDRQLGLVPSSEEAEDDTFLEALADAVSEYVDIDQIIQIAESAAPLAGLGDENPDRCALRPEKDSSHTLGMTNGPNSGKVSSLTLGMTVEPNSEKPSYQLERSASYPEQPPCHPEQPPCHPERSEGSFPRIGVIRDKAFCFYYEENLKALENEGAELVFINSLEDAALPANIHALYIGGGYPEEYAEQLSANKNFLSSVRQACNEGLPVYAECGGLMFLGRTIEYKDKTFNMVGALELDTVMRSKRQAHGYSVLEALKPEKGERCLSWIEPGTLLIGHEYHFSEVINRDDAQPLILCNKRGQGIEGGHDGIASKNILAMYAHINAYASPTWASQFVAQARLYQT